MVRVPCSLTESHFGRVLTIELMLYRDGAEVICLENYGIELAVVDPAIYGYGGSKWRQKFNTMLNAAKQLDLTIDFALGPTQGASIPIHDPDSPGMNTELAVCTLTGIVLLPYPRRGLIVLFTFSTV